MRTGRFQKPLPVQIAHQTAEGWDEYVLHGPVGAKSSQALWTGEKFVFNSNGTVAQHLETMPDQIADNYLTLEYFVP